MEHILATLIMRNANFNDVFYGLQHLKNLDMLLGFEYDRPCLFLFYVLLSMISLRQSHQRIKQIISREQKQVGTNN